MRISRSRVTARGPQPRRAASERPCRAEDRPAGRHVAAGAHRALLVRGGEQSPLGQGAEHLGRPRASPAEAPQELLVGRARAAERPRARPSPSHADGRARRPALGATASRRADPGRCGRQPVASRLGRCARTRRGLGDLAQALAGQARPAGTEHPLEAGRVHAHRHDLIEERVGRRCEQQRAFCILDGDDPAVLELPQLIAQLSEQHVGGRGGTSAVDEDHRRRISRSARRRSTSRSDVEPGGPSANAIDARPSRGPSVWPASSYSTSS